MKRCRKCGETKPLDQFDKDASAKDGKIAICKVCRKERDAKYRTKKKLNPHGYGARLVPLHHEQRKMGIEEIEARRSKLIKEHGLNPNRGSDTAKIDQLLEENGL